MAKQRVKRTAKRKSKGQRASHGASQQTSMLPFIGLGILAAIVLIGIGAVIGANVMGTSGSGADADDTRAPTIDTAQPVIDAPIGNVTSCQHNPDFSQELGFARVAIDTSRSRGKGLVLFDIAANDTFDKRNIYQHETWDDAGDIGSYTVDARGNIYVAPFPHVDLYENSPETQNTLHRIDTASSVMAEFVTLPTAQPASTQNPFGIVGLTYDCETDSLYAASLAGSTQLEELGRIYQIDVTQAEVVAQLEGVDAYGLGIFNSPHSKRLYFGRARSSDVYSIALDEMGAFREQPRRELALSEFYSTDALVARRVTFRETHMKVDGFKFQYNLVPMTEQGPRPSFSFIYNESSDAWQFVEMNRDDF